MKFMYGVIFCSLFTALPMSAQESFTLSDDEITQLDIRFAPVRNLDGLTGSRFPATVIVSPNATSKVNSSFGGTLLQWHANPGDSLDSGAPVASIRSSELLAIQSQWLSLESERELARFELQRDQNLLDLGIVSEQRLQQTRRKLQQVEIGYTALEQQLQQAGFDSNALEALKLREADLGIYQVRAPAAGVLTQRRHTTGDIIAAFSELAALQQNDEVWLSAEIPARIAMYLHADFELSLAETNEKLLLRQKELVVDASTQTVEVLAEFLANTNYMPGQVLTLILPPVGNGVLIPASAVVHNGDDTTVFLRTADGVEVRNLELEPAGANYLARTGIEVGEEVAVQGTAVLKGLQLGLGQSE